VRYAVVTTLRTYITVQIYRAVPLPQSEGDLIADAEYVMVNKLTRMLQCYCTDSSPLLGISVLVLADETSDEVDEDAGGNVQHFSHFFAQTRSVPCHHCGLYLTLHEVLKQRFQTKDGSSRIGCHAHVVPVKVMTLDELVSRVACCENCQICRFVEGCDIKEESNIGKISLTGVDTAIGKLIKLLNAFSARLSGSTRRLASTISSIIVSAHSLIGSSQLTADVGVASGINAFFHHLDSTMDPCKHVK
jgi:hypothetical protein